MIEYLHMQNLPTAEVYQKGAHYMPWGILVSEIEQYVIGNTPRGGTVLDLLCGTGYILGELCKKRPDLKYIGVDLEKDFITYAQKEYPAIEFHVDNAITWNAEQKYDVVLCTGGLHHISYDQQKEFLGKIASLIRQGGFAIVGDPYIDDYTNEQERKLAATKLGYEYLVATIKNGATDDVIKATASLIENDVLCVEFKDSVKNVEPYLKEYFSFIDKHKTWPKKKTQYGDYYFILKK